MIDGVKHIAFLCSSTSWGGLEMNVVRFANWLGDAGFTTTLWCVLGSPIDQEAAKTSLEVVHIRRHRKYVDVRAAWLLSRMFSRYRVDVVWIRDTRDMSVCGWAKVFSGRFKLVYQQAMQLGVSKRDVVHTLRFRQIDRWVAPLHYLAKQVITHTRFPEERLCVIPLAVDTERFGRNFDRHAARRTLQLPENATIIGNVGRLDPLKGQDFLIESLGLLAKKGFTADLLVVGDPTRNEGDRYMIHLHERVIALGLSDRVHFRPHRHDVEVAYAATDLFVMASAGETFGMVTIEAMASGCVVMGTNASGTPELLDDGRGMLFEPGDAEGFVACLIRLLSSPELRRTMSEKSHTYAHSTFSKGAVVAELSRMIQAL